MLDQSQQLRILAEEMLAYVRPGLDGVFHELAVADLVHALDEQAALVLSQDGIPVMPPDHLDDVPACPAESGLQFLDDFAVAAHGAVEALQVAVDYEDEIVEPFARGERQSAQ